MNPKNAGFLVPNLLLHLMLERTKLRRRLVAGGLKIGQLGRNFVVFQAFGVGIHEDLVNAECSSDSHAGRNGDSLAHKRQNVPLWAEVDKPRLAGGTLQGLRVKRFTAKRAARQIVRRTGGWQCPDLIGIVPI